MCTNLPLTAYRSSKKVGKMPSSDKQPDDQRFIKAIFSSTIENTMEMIARNLVISTNNKPRLQKLGIKDFRNHTGHIASFFLGYFCLD